MTENNSFAAVTDPARELTDLCKALANPQTLTGDKYLAAQFKVEPWSAEFFQIIFAISERIEQLTKFLDKLGLDDDMRSEAVNNLARIRLAFTPNGLNRPWKDAVGNFINPTNVGPIRMLSPQVRTICAYPRLEADEISEVLAELDELLVWLKEHQLKDEDFIRRAIIDGVEQFRFRLDRIKWLGWGYSLQSLREVITAYMALERAMPDAATSPDAAAILKKTKATLIFVTEKVGMAKGFTDNADFILKAYGAATLLLQGTHGIAGLLTYLGNG